MTITLDKHEMVVDKDDYEYKELLIERLKNALYIALKDASDEMIKNVLYKSEMISKAQYDSPQFFSIQSLA